MTWSQMLRLLPLESCLCCLPYPSPLHSSIWIRFSSFYFSPSFLFLSLVGRYEPFPISIVHPGLVFEKATQERGNWAFRIYIHAVYTAPHIIAVFSRWCCRSWWRWCMMIPSVIIRIRILLLLLVVVSPPFSLCSQDTCIHFWLTFILFFPSPHPHPHLPYQSPDGGESSDNKYTTALVHFILCLLCSDVRILMLHPLIFASFILSFIHWFVRAITLIFDCLLDILSLLVPKHFSFIPPFIFFHRPTTSLLLFLLCFFLSFFLSLMRSRSLSDQQHRILIACLFSFGTLFVLYWIALCCFAFTQSSSRVDFSFTCHY